MTDDSYVRQVEAWRQQREASLRAEHGWLSLAGLTWLHEGVNTLGTASDCDIVLPKDSAPPVAGRIVWHDGMAQLIMEQEIEAQIEGALAREVHLLPDTSGSPTMVDLGRVRLGLIHRGARDGIRVWDPDRPNRLSFRGRIWFPIDEGFRCVGAFIPYEQPKPIMVTNILGDSEPSTIPGRAVFTLGGQTVSLEVSSVDADGLFLMFSDGSSGETTYPSGRYLVAPKLAQEKWDLDFNRAYNPPCAFTPYATCELPPWENRLALRIESGERYERHDDPGVAA